MSSNDSLRTLRTALIDARKGYEEAVKDAEKPELKSIFQKMIVMHEQSHDTAHQVLVGRGETPDATGSFMAAVHKTVISVRSAVAGLDSKSLSSFASGEERIVKDYDATIEDNTDDVSVAEILAQQKSALLEMISEMKRLAA